MAILAPSVLGADFSRLGDEIRSAVEAGVDFFHLDIMDGHFVPNISFGPAVVKTIDGITDAYMDVHLMLSEPEKYFEAFVEAGADSISFHIKARPDPVPHAKRLRQLGVSPAITLNPDVPFERVKPYIEHFDMILFMSVYPGFGGQAFIEDVLSKVSEARKFIDDHGLNVRIQIDGGVDADNARRVTEAGADILVMGTAFFGSADRKGLVQLVETL